MIANGWGATVGNPSRSVNQDAFLVTPWKHGGLFIVMDGIGTSDALVRAAISAVAAQYRSVPWENVLLDASLLGALRAAQQVFAAAPAGGGAAIALASVAGHGARLAWIGGCRIWRLRGRTCELLAQDDRRRLCVLSGDARTIHDVESRLIGVEPGDRFLLASDGVWGPLELWTLQARISVDAAALPAAGADRRAGP